MINFEVSLQFVIGGTCGRCAVNRKSVDLAAESNAVECVALQLLVHNAIHSISCAHTGEKT